MMNETEVLHQTLELFGLEEAQTELLRSLNNHIYCVTAESGTQYSLRICPAEFKQRRWLEDELAWLDYLAGQNQIQVPRPVRNQQGDLLNTLSTPAGDRLSCLFEWLEGEKSSPHLTPSIMEQIGEITAHLHQAARAFPFPDKDNDFRADYTYDSTLAASHREWIQVHREEIGSENVALLLKAVDYVLEEFHKIGANRDNFGIIHADLHFGNFLVHEGQVSVIDFDQLGRGHYNFDMAVVMIELQDEPAHFSTRWAHFLAGYQRVADLPFSDESELAPFIVAVDLAFLDWVYNAPNPAVRAEKMQWVPGIYESILTTVQTS